MATPFTASISLTPAEVDGSPSKPVTVGQLGTYTERSDQMLVYTGSATEVVSLGTITSPGCAALMVQYTTIGATLPTASITLLLDGAVAGGTGLMPGGFFFVTLTGITALSITHTAACVIRVLSLG